MNGMDQPDEMTVDDYLAVDRAVAEVFGREPTLTREELEATATFPRRNAFDLCPPYGCPERRPRVQDREPRRRSDGGTGGTA